jgi:4-amino-4-deoxy-L-arabinose transferase-like glycosyltransferase
MVVFLLGQAARCRQYFGNPSYWYDEAFLTVSIYDCSFWQLIGALPGRTITPPFFLWLLRGCYLAFGPQEWALRLPAFVAGVAASFLIIPLARRWLGSPGWPWAVAFCALSTHCVNHAVEVRPYATDFLMTVVILLAGHAYLNALTPRRQWWGCGLLLAAALAPWLSFSSAFVLAAASAALFLDCWRRKDLRGWLFWLTFNGLLLLTSFLIWQIQARHLYYPGLKEEWTFGWGGFPRDFAALTLLSWTGRALVSMGHYASDGLGIPLVLLGAVGIVRCWRRSPAEALLLAGPIGVAYLASLLGKYPFADRTIFFLAPCVWLLAVEGVLQLGQSLPKARAAAIPLIILALMTPGILKSVKMCVRILPMMEYREALVFVHDHRGEGEAVWSWCQDLNSVYACHVFSWLPQGLETDPHDAVEATRAARDRPLWVVAPDGAVEDMTRPLRSLAVRQTLCRQFLGVKVLRFAAAARLGSSGSDG